MAIAINNDGRRINSLVWAFPFGLKPRSSQRYRYLLVGNETAETFDLVEKGHPYRKVLIDPSHPEWHEGRYGSGLYPTHTESEWQDVKELVENRVKKGR